ncbi:MAG: dihydrolipoyl dehydrogenase [Propionibacteriaceae bacterium]|nr:dihydrolipoyl dehydrogenase [Propionibacteriaceae bacterium]
MTPHQVDVIIVGSGPGGYVAAVRAAQLGLKVAIVEGRWWGGVCLNAGCIPAKALVRNAEVAELVTKHGTDFGLKGDVTVDYTVGWRRSRDVADRMAKGVRHLMKKNRIEAIDGWATFTGPNSLSVAQADGAVSEWTFQHAIVATGAHPKLLPGVSVGGPVMTYEQMIMAESLPKSLIIAGSGAVGVEFASIAASFGVDVTIVEFLDRIVPNEDETISKELTRALTQRGIKIHTGTAVTNVRANRKVTVTTEPASGGEPGKLRADALLLALGFAPNTGGFGLDATGVTLNDGGFIATDDLMRTSVPSIFAIGDVTGKLMLAHVAQRQGVIAAEVIAGLQPEPIDYDSIPRATYTDPPIGSLGLTVAQARDAGYDVKVSRFPFAANGKAQGLGEPGGFALLVADATHHEILGAHLIGADATELLPELVLAKTWDLTAEEVGVTVHAHPTLSEVVKGAAEGIVGHAIDL